jgi:hypothetical protein
VVQSIGPEFKPWYCKKKKKEKEKEVFSLIFHCVFPTLFAYLILTIFSPALDT